MSLISLGSDNHSGVHPELFEEMLKVNEGFAPAYGQDDISQRLRKIILEKFDAIDTALVFNGTAANVISLQMGLNSYESVICSDVSHLHVDECGAPEKIAGVKLVTLPSEHGKISASDIKKHIIRRGDQHFSQVKMVSITQPTEYGTLYSLEELKAIREVCDQNQLYLHIDGARFANALVAMNLNFKDLARFADILSFGGAKNGLMLGEFVVVRNPNLKEGLKFFRKQSLQLPSKTRFLSAPFIKYLESSLWKEMAQHENHMALKLRDGLSQIAGIEITQPTQANAVFCKIPREWVKKLKKKYFFYVWNEETFECRLMTSFSTTAEHIQGFLDETRNLTNQRITL